VFVIMELVEGETLAAWLRRAPRSWRDVAAVFADAGRGLAAAHAAGIVHRDFKPENVLLGADGRARVTDFGLARRVPPARAAGAVSGAPAAAAVTTTTAGTPAYMAPEQFLDGSADARTDQFNFCVALHLALFGRHPSADGDGHVPTTLLGAVGHLVQDHFPAVVDAAQVPGWLRALLRRGLSPRPEDRHAGMQPIIDALARTGPRTQIRTRRLAAGAAVAAALAAGAAAILGGRAPAPAVCGDGRVDRGEQCDDGNRADDDACVRCRWARCGDGFVRKGVEECDGGPPCAPSCVLCRGDAAFVWSETGACYMRHDRPASWADARRICASEAADLVMYDSYHEAGAVRDGLLLGAPATWWLGATVDAQRGTVGLDGRRAVSARWVADTALEPKAGQCVAQAPRPFRGTSAVDPGLTWTSVPCERPLPYVCEKGAWSLRAATNHAYRVDLHAVTWAAARSACVAAGAHLATIADADEQSFVAALAAEDMWIGATDEGREGRFEWVTGEPFSFSRFAPGEPDDRAHTDNCITLASDELWHDRNCGLVRGFVCEMD
jgi:cysteine-rich repeat protein